MNGNAAMLPSYIFRIGQRGAVGVGGGVYTYVVDDKNETSGRPFPGHAERLLVLLHVVDSTPIDIYQSA